MRRRLRFLLIWKMASFRLLRHMFPKENSTFCVLAKIRSAKCSLNVCSAVNRSYYERGRNQEIVKPLDINRFNIKPEKHKPRQQSPKLQLSAMKTLLEEEQDGDLPVQNMPNPYEKDQHRCILCKYNIDLDYKNIQLLSQFVSPYTGQILGRKVTGLCIPMQKRVSKLIRRARIMGFMPYMHKEVTYLTDPRLFNPLKSVK